MWFDRQSWVFCEFGFEFCSCSSGCGGFSWTLDLILGQMLHSPSARLEGNIETIVSRLLSAPLTVMNAMRDDCSEYGFKAVFSYGLLLSPCYFPGGQIGGFVDSSLFWEQHWRAPLNSFKSKSRLNYSFYDCSGGQFEEQGGLTDHMTWSTCWQVRPGSAPTVSGRNFSLRLLSHAFWPVSFAWISSNVMARPVLLVMPLPCASVSWKQMFALVKAVEALWIVVVSWGVLMFLIWCQSCHVHVMSGTLLVMWHLWQI